MVNRIGIVGTGDIATQFVKQVDLKKYQIESVFNRNSVSLERFQKEHDIQKGYVDYDKFLSDTRLEVVYIATPNQTHYDYIKRALLAKKHVLCEKVMVLTSQEEQELAQIAKDQGVVLLEAMSLFYMPMFKAVKEEMEAGTIGTISGVNVTFGSVKEYDPNNRFFSPEKGGGALFDIGTYALSAAVYLLGTDIELLSSHVLMSPSQVDEKSVTTLQNKEGQMASVMISFRGKMPKQVIVSGDEGYIMIEDFPRGTQATIYLNDGRLNIIETGDSLDVFTYEMDHLNQLIEKQVEVSEDTRSVTSCVIGLMDDMRKQWNWTI